MPIREPATTLYNWYPPWFTEGETKDKTPPKDCDWMGVEVPKWMG